VLQEITRRWNTIAGRRNICILACGLAPIVVRVCSLPFYPIPVPATHDEFSYLLAAETFAKGRLTNPTPPFWEHFETFHELMRPTYMSMYPPGQGAMLALGYVILGHPWYAVLLSLGVMCAVLLWMLYEWLPPGWALLGGILGVCQFGIAHYWINGYWGGSLAAIGGCLTLGAYARVIRRVRVLDGLLVGIGLGIVANTRPYEGIPLGLVVLVGLLLWMIRQPAAARVAAILRVAIPIAVGVAPFVAATLLEAKAVTGSALTLPHQFARREVAVLPTFVFQAPHPIPAYHHEVLRKFYVEWEPGYEDARDWGTLRGLIPGIRERARVVGACYFPDRLYLPLALVSLLALWSRPIRFLGVCVLAALLANAAVRWLVPHYFAPILGALMAVHLQFLRWVRGWKQTLFVAILVFLCMLFGYRYSSRAGTLDDWASERLNIVKKLEADGRRHIVFVQYTPQHILQHEWVFNGPDIPSQKVIWARVMQPAEDQALLAYYKDRVAWVVDADAHPANLRLFRPQ